MLINFVKAPQVPDIVQDGQVNITVHEGYGQSFDLFKYAKDNKVEVYNQFDLAEDGSLPLLDATGKIAILFTSGKYTSTSMVQDVLLSLTTPIMVVGGAAGDNLTFDSSSINGVKDAFVLILMELDDEYELEKDVISAFYPVGKPFTVTKAKGSIILEIEGRKPSDFIREILNVAEDEALEPHFFAHPLSQYVGIEGLDEEFGQQYIKSMQVVLEDGSIQCAADIFEGCDYKITSPREYDFMKEVYCKEGEGLNIQCAYRTLFLQGADTENEMKELALSNNLVTVSVYSEYADSHLNHTSVILRFRKKKK